MLHRFLSLLAVSSSYGLYYFTMLIVEAGHNRNYALSTANLAAAIDDWSAAYAGERMSGFLLYQPYISTCPGAVRSIPDSIAWNNMMTTARATVSSALPLACTASETPTNIMLAWQCTDDAAAAMVQAGRELGPHIEDEVKAELVEFLEDLQARVTAQRGGGGGGFVCPRPSDFARGSTYVARLVQHAHQALNVVTTAEFSDQADAVQDAGAAVQAAYFAELAGIEILRSLFMAETAVNASAGSGGNLTVAQAAKVGDATVLPLLVATSRLADAAANLQAKSSFRGTPQLAALSTFADAALNGAMAMLENDGDTLALRALVNMTAAAWAVRMSTVAAGLSHLSDTLMGQYVQAAEMQRIAALASVSTPVSRTVQLPDSEVRVALPKPL